MNPILKLLTLALSVPCLTWNHAPTPLALEHRVLMASDPTDPMPKPKPVYTPGSHNAPAPSGRRG
jgi:hypothetical protein